MEIGFCATKILDKS